MTKARSNKLYTILAIILVILGAAIRLYDVTDEPLEAHATRQFRSAIIARTMYYETNPDVPARQIEFAKRQSSQVGLIEPSILEWLTAQSYRLAGQELIWLGRLFTIAFWLLGAFGVYQLAVETGSPMGGLLALAYYLFLPFGVRLSRTLMPDPIMISLSVLALWALVRWQKQRTNGWALAAGLLTGAAILVKTVAGIILIVPFALYILSAFPLKKALTEKALWLILVLAVLPTATYYIWGIFIDGRLATQFSGRFFPQLWGDIVVYKAWGLRIIQQFSLKAFLVGLAGIVLARRKNDRWLLFGWWAGYFVYGMLFIYYTWTHDYYHLPMVPLIAVSLSPTITALIDYAKGKRFEKWALAGIGVAVAYVSISGIVQAKAEMDAVDYRLNRQAIEELDDFLSTLPDDNVIALTDNYETSVQFYTFHNYGHWPNSGEANFVLLQGNSADKFEDVWKSKLEKNGYFLVLDFKDLNRQPELIQKLKEYPVLAQTEYYVLYDIKP